jgi:hypothetical protein
MLVSYKRLKEYSTIKTIDGSPSVKHQKNHERQNLTQLTAICGRAGERGEKPKY